MLPITWSIRSNPSVTKVPTSPRTRARRTESSLFSTDWPSTNLIMSPTCTVPSLEDKQTCQWAVYDTSFWCVHAYSQLKITQHVARPLRKIVNLSADPPLTIVLTYTLSLCPSVCWKNSPTPAWSVHNMEPINFKMPASIWKITQNETAK